MAWTLNKKLTVFGDMRVMIISATADAATQNVDTGLDNIHGFSVGPISMKSTNSWRVAPNSHASGTEAFGYLGCSGFTSGDEVYFVVYGK